MPSYSKFIAVPIVLLAWLACKSPDPIVLKDGSAAESVQACRTGLERWQKNPTTYFYWRIRSSVTGAAESTGVQVVEGRPVARYYKALRGTGPAVQVATSWSETGDRLGAHRAGAAARSMDELYELCRSSLERSGDLRRLVRIDGRGVLSACHTAERRCMDDCGENFGVQGVVFGRLSETELKKFLTHPGTVWRNQ